MAKGFKSSVRKPSPLAEIISPGPRKATTPALKSAGRIRPEVPARVNPVVAAAIAESGLSAAAAEGRLGSPAALSGQQMIAEELKSSGFGEGWRKKLESTARQSLIQLGKTDTPNDADIKAEAYDMAVRQAEGIGNQKMRNMVMTMIRNEFGVVPSGNLSKGVEKVPVEKRRKGIVGTGKNVEELKQEQIQEMATRARERRPHEIATGGINDVALLADIQAMDKAVSEGDEQAYQKSLRRFEQRLSAHLLLSGEISSHDLTFTSKGAVGGISAEEGMRPARYAGNKGGKLDRGERRPPLEGKTTQPGAISREPTQMAHDALDVIATDPALLDRFLSRFNEKDQIALRKKFKQINKLPSSEANYMRKGELLRAFDKALSIEGISKSMEIAQESKDPRQLRALQSTAFSPAQEAEQRESGRVAQRAVSDTISLVDRISKGRRYQATSAGRALMKKDISDIVGAFKKFTADKDVIAGIQGRVRAAIGRSAAGNHEGIIEIGKILNAVRSQGLRRTPGVAEQIGETAGSMPQIEAIISGVGTRIRGGASTRAAKPGRNVLTGKIVKTGIAEIPPTAPSRRGEVTGLEHEEVKRVAPAPTLKEMRDADLPEHLKATSDRITRQADIKERREAYKAPEPSELDKAIDQFRTAVMGDARKAGDPDTLPDFDSSEAQRAASILNERLRSLSKAYKTEMDKLSKSRGPGEIRNAKQLSQARAELQKLEQEIASGKRDLDSLTSSNVMSYGREFGLRINRGTRFSENDPMSREKFEDAPFISKGDSRELFTTELIKPKLVREYKEALESRIKMLESQVTDWEKAVESGVRLLEKKGANIDTAFVNAATREGVLRGTKQGTIEALKRQLESKTLEPKERARIEAILERDAPKRRPVQVATEAPRPGTRPLPGMFAPAPIAKDIRDRREITGGSVVGGEVAEAGRPISDVRREVERARKSGKRVKKPRSQNLRIADRERLKQFGKMQELMGAIDEAQGLPR